MEISNNFANILVFIKQFWFFHPILLKEIRSSTQPKMTQKTEKLSFIFWHAFTVDTALHGRTGWLIKKDERTCVENGSNCDDCRLLESAKQMTNICSYGGNLNIFPQNKSRLTTYSHHPTRKVNSEKFRTRTWQQDTGIFWGQN